jgi:hypothetical protein
MAWMLRGRRYSSVGQTAYSNRLSSRNRGPDHLTKRVRGRPECGGRAALAVHLVSHPTADPSATIEANGILQVECLFGNPPKGAMEGIRLNVQDLINFNKSVSGVTLYIKAPQDGWMGTRPFARAWSLGRGDPNRLFLLGGAPERDAFAQTDPLRFQGDHGDGGCG